MQRIPSLDLARGFTVLMIAPVHTVLFYSRPEVHATLVGQLLTFIAEGPGAQLFMLLMGVYCAFQKHLNTGRIFRRSAILLVAACMLNTIKFVIPAYLGWLPPALLQELGYTADSLDFMQLFLIGDILHFAALALICLCFIRHLPRWHHAALLGALLVCFVAPYCWDLHSATPLIDFILSLIGAPLPRTFFPLFPWLVYPLAGLAIGHYLQQPDHHHFSCLRDTGACLIGMGWLIRTFLPDSPATSFYRTLAPETLQHLGIVLVTLYVWHCLEKSVLPNAFFRLLEYTSRHITQIYCIQWIIIIWLLPCVGFRELNYHASLFAICCTTISTLAISFAINLLIRIYSTSQ